MNNWIRFSLPIRLRGVQRMLWSACHISSNTWITQAPLPEFFLLISALLLIPSGDISSSGNYEFSTRLHLLNNFLSDR